MKLTLRVDFTDGAQATVVTNLWVITQWERKYKSKITQMATGIGAEDLAFLAYEACKVSNVVVDAAFDSFIKKGNPAPTPSRAASSDGLVAPSH
jgi:hypothetical protein